LFLDVNCSSRAIASVGSSPSILASISSAESNPSLAASDISAAQKLESPDNFFFGYACWDFCAASV